MKLPRTSNRSFLDDSPKASDGRPLVVPVDVKGHTKYAVISGNGRSAAIKEAYRANSDKAKEYADFARSKDNSTNHHQPVYVGELDPKQIDLHSFAREANESATATMSATEQAKTDAEKISTGLMNSFVPAEDGSIHNAANRDFIKGFLNTVPAKTDVGQLVTADGSLSQTGVTRVKNALFASAFGDTERGLNAIARMSEATDNNAKNLTNALLKSAPRFAAFKSAAKDGTRYKSLDISADVPLALEKLSSLKSEGTSIDDFINQGNLFGSDLTPFQTRLLQTFDNYNRSAKAVSTILDNYLRGAEAVGDPNQVSLFGNQAEPTPGALLQAATEDYEQNKQLETTAGKQVNLFDGNQGRENRPESSENLSPTDSTGKGETAGRTDTDTERADAERLAAPQSEPTKQTEQTTSRAPKAQQAEDMPQPGAVVTINGRSGKLEKIVYGKARVKFPGKAKAELVNLSDLDVPDRGVSYSQSSGEAKMQRMLEGLRDKKQPTELLAQAVKFTPSSDGKMVFANPEAVEIMRRAITIAENGKEAPVFFGAYLKPSSLVKVGHALLKMRSDLPVGESRKAITELLRTVGDDKFAEAGLPIIAANRDFTPVNSTTIQEELAHQADFMTRGRIAAKHILKSAAARKAARKVKETYGDISSETLAKEVIAKSFRDDAANELEVSEDELGDIRDAYMQTLMQKGIGTAKIADAFGDVSEIGKDFATYVKTGTNGKSGGRGVVTQSDGTEIIHAPVRGGGTVRDGQTSRQANQTARLGSGGQALDGRVSNEGLGDVPPTSQINPLVRIPAPERLRLERAFKGNDSLMRQAAEEVLMSRAKQPEPKTAIGKLVAKAVRGTTDIMTAPQSLITSVDLSAALRQGDILTLSEPKLAAIAFVRQLNSLRQKGFDDFVDNLTQHPYIGLAEHSDLYLSTLADSHALGQREEAFMSRLLGDDPLFKIKIAEGIRKLATLHVRASERAYKTYLDSIRMDAFAKFSREVHEFNVRKGQPDTDEQYAAIASFINKATGRGTLGGLEDAAPLLNSFFFSPRYWASRVQLLNPAFYAKLPAGCARDCVKKDADVCRRDSRRDGINEAGRSGDYL